MVDKTVGVTGKLKVLLTNRQDVHSAFIFGSYAAGRENSLSDIDLMVLGDVRLRSLMALLKNIKQECGREINPHIMSVEEFSKRAQAKEHFISSVMQSAKAFVKGGENDLVELAGQRLAAPS
jgi:predicted nucleotidyltransferase